MLPLRPWCSAGESTHLAQVESELPTAVGEVGDTWVTSQTADPWKWIFYREASRVYAECLAAGECDPAADQRIARSAGGLAGEALPFASAAGVSGGGGGALQARQIEQAKQMCTEARKLLEQLERALGMIR